MSTVSDYTLANQSFANLRAELNTILAAINTLNATTSAPGSKAAGSLWLDTTSATTPTLKFYDGADWISLCTFNYSANTVNWLDNTVVADVVGDTSPQLGGMRLVWLEYPKLQHLKLKLMLVVELKVDH